MPKKSRRRKRQRPAGTLAGPPATAPVAARARQRISWTGLIGAVLGFAPLFALAVEILVDPPGVGRPFATVPLLMAAMYVPALWASVARTERRQAILRGSLAASLVLAFTGSTLFGPVLLIVLVPATALLAVAGRLVWQR